MYISLAHSSISVNLLHYYFLCLVESQVPVIAEKIKQCGLVGPETVVIPLQNGLESVTSLRDVLGESHVCGGLCKIYGFIEAPGRVICPSGPVSIDFGGLGGASPGASNPHLIALREAFTYAGWQPVTRLLRRSKHLFGPELVSGGSIPVVLMTMLKIAKMILLMRMGISMFMMMKDVDDDDDDVFLLTPIMMVVRVRVILPFGEDAYGAAAVADGDDDGVYYNMFDDDDDDDENV